MRAQVRVVGGQADLVSLHQWLVREDELRGRVTLHQPPPEPGQLGVATDVLVVALSGGGAITVLASSLQIWLKQRHSDVTIEVTNPDGRSVKVTAARVADAARLVREVLGDE
ncbi:effector-associated constant component EACC1 [Allokutzneria oryzae]|uniref:Uncharacterized protein n=1 Tax=Allokutzneria oryzae TaxID=1378989 RepID=A0ABV6A1N3_9PSEU